MRRPALLYPCRVTEKAAFVKVVATEDGGSAFEEGELVLELRDISAGMPPLLVAAISSSGAGTIFLRGDGFASEPHPAPREQWVVMLRGSVEIEVSDGSRRTFGPGDLLLVTDLTGRGHTTRTVGEPPFEGLFVPV